VARRGFDTQTAARSSNQPQRRCMLFSILLTRLRYNRRSYGGVYDVPQRDKEYNSPRLTTSVSMSRRFEQEGSWRPEPDRSLMLIDPITRCIRAMPMSMSLHKQACFGALPLEEVPRGLPFKRTQFAMEITISLTLKRDPNVL
jgi:hypothetical protein